jgi:hypothetical protein
MHSCYNQCTCRKRLHESRLLGPRYELLINELSTATILPNILPMYVYSCYLLLLSSTKKQRTRLVTIRYYGLHYFYSSVYSVHCIFISHNSHRSALDGVLTIMNLNTSPLRHKYYHGLTVVSTLLCYYYYNRNKKFVLTYQSYGP